MIKMYKKEVPKLNKENFPTWKSLMKFHLVGIGDSKKYYVEHDYVAPAAPMTIEEMKLKQEHNQAMLEIASALSYPEFEDIKECTTTKKIWDTLTTIYGGDTNVLRAKSESLRGNFDEMKMLEGENIAQYCGRIKEIVNAIRGSNGIIDDETFIRKVLRTFLYIYAIRISTIQESRCNLGNVLNLESLVGKLAAFELSNYDNYTVPNVESAFKSQMVLHKSKREEDKCVKSGSDSDTYDEELDDLEALMDRRFKRGKGKYKGKLPIICFSCNKVGHITATFPNRNDKDQERESKYKDKRDNKDHQRYKDYKEKGKKSCYIAEEETDSDSDNFDIEVVYVAMKDDSDKDEKIALISYMSKGGKWIIDNGFSHHMTSDKSKFETLDHYRGRSVKFGNDVPCPMRGK